MGKRVSATFFKTLSLFIDHCLYCSGPGACSFRDWLKSKTNKAQRCSRLGEQLQSNFLVGSASATARSSLSLRSDRRKTKKTKTKSKNKTKTNTSSKDDRPRDTRGEHTLSRLKNTRSLLFIHPPALSRKGCVVNGRLTKPSDN